MTQEVEQVDQSDMQLSRRDLMGSSAVVAAGAMGIGMMGVASAQDGPTDEISGTVTDTDGNAIDGATVVAVPHDSSLDALVTTTDANGAYIFSQSDLHDNSNLYHVVARDGTETSPLRSQQNYPFIAAEGGPTIPDSGMFQDPIYQWWAGEGIGVNDGQTASSWEGQLASITASASGGPTFRSDTSGEPNVEFDGADDYYTWSADSQLPTGVESWAWAALIYFDTLPGADTARTVAVYGGNSADNMNQLRIENNSVAHDFWADNIIGNTTLPSGQWVTIGVSYDGSDRTVYLNGSPDGSDSPGSKSVTDENHRIARRAGGSAYLQAHVSEIILTSSADGDTAFSEYHQDRLG